MPAHVGEAELLKIFFEGDRQGRSGGCSGVDFADGTSLRGEILFALARGQHTQTPTINLLVDKGERGAI
jgi:hypothetical protein